jgi:hypothetical protein
MSGSLFFRIIQTLSDAEEEIRHLTTFYIQQRLLKRYPKVMFNHFVEALFHFNEYVVSFFACKIIDVESQVLLDHD